MKKAFVFYLIVTFLLAQAAIAIEKPHFSKTITLLRKAFLEKDIPTITKHVALSSIVRSKLKKKILTKAIVRLIIYQFSRSSRTEIKSYLSHLKIKKTGQKGRSAYASGSFMGEKTYLSAIWHQGSWVIVGVGSAFIDKELNKLLKI